FGAKESEVEFTPDLLEDLTLQVRNNTISGRYFRQEYEAVGGQVVGRYAHGKPAAIEHSYGKGRVLLIGSFPGAGYFRNHTPGTKNFFSGLLPWAGVQQKLSVNVPAVKARLHQGAGGTFLWVLNPSRTPQKITVRLQSELGSFSRANDLWQPSNTVRLNGLNLDLAVGDRNAAVIKLLP
ncbi:MAG: hypothetical protein H7039_17030, partial [Bryobacteraceae bacterium]|nr:hypothetical protein [Bryobacteraceae bacterium]